MDTIRQLLHGLTNVEGIIRWGGYFALAAIIFSETGLMVGFFLPGDSLLVAAGLFAGRGDLDLFALWALLVPMAIAGNSTGYAIGRQLGSTLFARPSSRLFNRRHLVRTQLFYEQHGGKTVVIAQFLPILRTFAPVVAGVARMHYRRFISFNVGGAICWILSMTSIGYTLGRVIPGIEHHIEWVILIVIATSFIPGVISSWRADRARRRRRAEFLAAMRDLGSALRTTHWDWSPEALPRLVAALPTPHESGVVSTGSGASSDRRVELTLAQSPPLSRLTEAGSEVAGWELDERFEQALRVLAEALGRAEVPTAGAETPAQRTAAWPAEGARLTLLQTRDQSHRLALRAEPA